MAAVMDNDNDDNESKKPSAKIGFWSPKLISDFLKMYRSLPCLWQVKSADYLNKAKKELAYEQLVELCRQKLDDVDADFVRSKINIFRGCFRKEWKKVKVSRQLGEVYTPRLWYYHLLLFTMEDQQSENQSSASNVVGSTTAAAVADVTQKNQINQDANYVPDKVATRNGDAAVPPSTTQSISRVQSAPRVRSLPRVRSVPKVRDMPRLRSSPRKRKNVDVDPEEEVSKPGLYEKAEKVLKLDEYDAFGVTVAAKLRKMGQKQAIFAEKLINDAVFKGMLDQLSHLSEIVTPNRSFIEAGGGGGGGNGENYHNFRNVLGGNPLSFAQATYAVETPENLSKDSIVVMDAMGNKQPQQCYVKYNIRQIRPPSVVYSNESSSSEFHLDSQTDNNC